jgi:hypothetical protein
MTQSSRLKIASYPLSMGVPLLVPLGVTLGVSWLAAIVLFGVLPWLGLIVGEDHSLPLVGLRRSRILVAYLHLLPRLYFVVWAAVLLWSAHYASAASLRLIDFLGLALSVGLSSALWI